MTRDEFSIAAIARSALLHAFAWRWTRPGGGAGKCRREPSAPV